MTMASLVEERRSVNLGSQASAFASPRSGSDFIEQNQDLSSSGGFEQCLKLEVVENFFGSVFPDTPTEPVKPIISEAWSTSYPSNQRQFVTPAATGYPDRNLAGRLSNGSIPGDHRGIPSVRACEPSWIAPLSSTAMSVSQDQWSLSPTTPTATSKVYSLSPATSQMKDEPTMDRSVSSTTFIGEDIKDSRFDVLPNPYYPYGAVTSTSAAYAHFSPYTCSKSPFYQDRTAKQCYQCSASGYTTPLYKTPTGHTVCEKCTTAYPSGVIASSTDSLGGRSSKATKRRMAGGNKRQGTQCNNCGTQKTTLWRRDAAGQAVCNACGLYYKLHQQNRPQNMKKDTIQSRNRKPGRKNTKKKQDMEQIAAVAAAAAAGSRYPDHMMSLPQHVQSHMLHPSQMMQGGMKTDQEMMQHLYSPGALMKQEQVYTYPMLGASSHMLPPPALSPLDIPHQGLTLNTLSPDTTKDNTDLGFLNR